MTPKIFLTGVTGYIGGDAFYAFEKAHPDWDYTVLVRSEDRARPVKDKYPKVKILYGSNDDADVLEKAAAEADIVVHTADSSDNVPSAKAIAKGLAKGHSAENPGYWIHICGTGILTWYDQTHKRYGQAPLAEEAYDDIKDIDRILNLPDQALHRDVDKIVLAANSAAVRTAILGPPTIYGPGRGPVNQRSMQVPELARFGLRASWVPYVGTGLTEWDNVNVLDLSDLFVTVAEAALDPAKNSDPEIFGPHAYYFVENGTHKWREVADWIAAEEHRRGFLSSDEATARQTDMEGIKTPEGGSNSTWALNSKSTATRARKYLGWKPSAPTLKETIPGTVDYEAKKLGLKGKD